MSTPFMRWFLCFALLLFGIVLGQSAPSAVDPIVGKWFWRGDLTVTFKADGTCKIDGATLEGAWRFLQNPEVERKYSINWDKGHIQNKVIFSRDGLSAQVQDLTKGDRFTARKSQEKTEQ